MKRLLPYLLGVIGVTMVITAFAIAAKPVSRNLEDFELVRKKRGDRLSLLGVGGTFLIGTGTVWGLLQRAKSSD